MLIQSSVDRQVMEVIVCTPGTALDDIVLKCPQLSWNQVFSAIDRLVRDGVVTLMPQGRGTYLVSLSASPETAASAREASS